MSRYTPHVVLIMEGGVIHQVFGFNTALNLVVVDRDKEVDVEDVAYCEELGGLVFPLEVEPIVSMHNHVWEQLIRHFEQLEVVDAEVDREVPPQATG